jgi:hypothetical protein
MDEAKRRIGKWTEGLLNLSSLGLNAVPAELAQLTNLTTLDLSGNQLTAVPAELAQLTNLTTLHLSGNQLTWLPSELSSTQLDRLTGSTGSGLSLSPGNSFPPGLLAAAEKGIEELWDYLRTNQPPGEQDHDASEGADDVADPPLSSYADKIEFVDRVPAPDAGDLRGSLERLIGLASVELQAGSFEADPLVEEQVTDDRNYLQRELARDPDLDTYVVVPIAERLRNRLAAMLPDDDPAAALAREIGTAPEERPQDPETAARRAEVLEEALEASGAELPDGASSWRGWLAARLGWDPDGAKQLAKEVAKDGATFTTGLITGAEVAAILGVAGPATILIGSAVAVLVTVFRRAVQE